MTSAAARTARMGLAVCRMVKRKTAAMSNADGANLVSGVSQGRYPHRIGLVGPPARMEGSLDELGIDMIPS